MSKMCLELIGNGSTNSTCPLLNDSTTDGFTELPDPTTASSDVLEVSSHRSVWVISVSALAILVVILLILLVTAYLTLGKGSTAQQQNAPPAQMVPLQPLPNGHAVTDEGEEERLAGA